MSNRVSNLLTFWLERMLLRGMRYRLLLVAMIIAALSVVAGAVVWILDPSIGNPAYAVWWAFLRITDTGYLGDDAGHVRRGVSTVLTLGGAVIFLGGLIAIMVQALDQALERLEAGLTPMVARNHIAILGWTNRTPQLIAELVNSEGRMRRFLQRRGARRLRIVVLAEQVTRELHHSLRERLGDSWSERLITFRSGSPLKYEHLRRVDVEHAAAVVIPGSDFGQAGPERIDANTVKTLLSISRHGRDDALSLPLAVAEISDPRRTSLAYDAYRGPLEVVAGDAIMASILAQCIRHPGLADVFSQVLTHEVGNEIHVRQFPSIVGRRMRGLDALFPQAIPLGTVRAGGADLRLDAPDDYVVDEEDRIVFLAPSHEACEPLRDPPEEPPPFGREPEAPPPPPMPARRRVLVLGWSPRVSALVAELGRYDAEGFDIDIASITPVAERETHLRHFDVPSGRVSTRQIEADYTVPSELRKIGPGRYDNVVLVSSQWTGAEEEADARTILAYLLLREILPESGPCPSILAEVMDAENLELFTRASCETVQPTVILSHMLAQVVLRRELGAVYQELFGPGGAEIIYRKAKEYDLLGCPVRFAELQAAAARRGEVALGLHFAASSSAESGALLNPPRDETFVLAADDDLILLTSYSSLPCL